MRISINGDDGTVAITIPKTATTAETVLKGTAATVARKAAALLKSPTVAALAAANPQVAIALRAARALAGTELGRRLVKSAGRGIKRVLGKLF